MHSGLCTCHITNVSLTTLNCSYISLGFMNFSRKKWPRYCTKLHCMSDPNTCTHTYSFSLSFCINRYDWKHFAIDALNVVHRKCNAVYWYSLLWMCWSEKLKSIRLNNQCALWFLWYLPYIAQWLDDFVISQHDHHIIIDRV